MNLHFRRFLAIAPWRPSIGHFWFLGLWVVDSVHWRLHHRCLYFMIETVRNDKWNISIWYGNSQIGFRSKATHMCDMSLWEMWCKKKICSKLNQLTLQRLAYKWDVNVIVDAVVVLLTLKLRIKNSVYWDLIQFKFRWAILSSFEYFWQRDDYLVQISTTWIHLIQHPIHFISLVWFALRKKREMKCKWRI